MTPLAEKRFKCLVTLLIHMVGFGFGIVAIVATVYINQHKPSGFFMSSCTVVTVPETNSSYYAVYGCTPFITSLPTAPGNNGVYDCWLNCQGAVSFDGPWETLKSAYSWQSAGGGIAIVWLGTGLLLGSMYLIEYCQSCQKRRLSPPLLPSTTVSPPAAASAVVTVPIAIETNPLHPTAV